MKASEKFTHEIAEKIKETIKDTGGNEVMFSGSFNSDRLIDSVIVAARGNEESVPAIEAFAEKGEAVIHNHPGGNLKPSAADLRIASILGSQGIGFFIIDNNAESVYVVAEPYFEKKKKLLNIEKLAAALSPGGGLSKTYEFFEPRDSQIEMLEFVCESFNREVITVAEAGTGVGKSLAYLLPAFQWVINNEDRVVISTATINLQHQLIEKDIPLVKKILNTDKKAALVKGRANYLCFRKYYEKINENALFDQENNNLNLIKEWAEVTETGDKSDMPMMPESGLWADICSESDYCLGIYCEHREKCFVIKARKNAATASVLVVNHHILFSDLAARSAGAGFNGTAILPAFRRIVFDEAHNIENAATSFFSSTLNKGFLIKTLRRIYSTGKGRVFGLYRFIELYAESGSSKHKEIPAAAADTLSLYAGLEKETEVLLEGRQNIRIEKSAVFEALFNSIAAVKKSINRIYLILDDFSQSIDLSPEDDSRVYELMLIKSRLKGLIEVCEMLIDTDDDSVSWIEKNRYVVFTVTPVDVSRMLKESLYEKINSIVLTSATLSINNNFNFWKKRIGLDSSGFTVMEQIFKSPFDFEKQVLLGVPEDISEPSSEEYTLELSDFIYEMLMITDGGSLILFTSYSMLLSVYGSLKDRIIDSGITLYKQGDYDRFQLLNMFNRDSKSVLMATDSFWEGVDSPGETLRLLIICRLPFKVPSDPVIKARMEKIEKEGGNPFMDYSLPEAVLKLKQGFGRLMRRKTDRGVVLVTDKRIVKKAYGKIFSSSLPQPEIYYAERKKLYRKVEDFFFS